MIDNTMLQNCGFVRDVQENLCDMLDNGLIQKSDAILKIFSEQTPKTDLFELSLYLFNFQRKEAIFEHKVFFACKDLFWRECIEYENRQTKEIEYYVLSYEYLPVTDNPVHFQLFCIDKNDYRKIPRSNTKHDKNLAKAVLKNYLSEFLLSETKSFCAWQNKNELLNRYKVDWRKIDNSYYYVES